MGISGVLGCRGWGGGCRARVLGCFGGWVIG